MVQYKRKKEAVIIRQEEIDKNIFSMWIKTGDAEDVKPGQFFGFYPKDKSHLMMRPISVCDIDSENNEYRFVYQVKGYGTTEFSGLSSGDLVSIIGPLGNGFPIDETASHTVLVGGGMGIAPLLGLAKQLKNKAIAVLGYRDTPFMVEEFIDAGCKVIIATESGMEGIHGTVVDALKKEDVKSLTAYTCGPIPMLKAVCEYAKAHDIDMYASLEEKMGCGVGACLGCVTPSVTANDHYRVNKLCVCKDGPVFHVSEVVL